MDILTYCKESKRYFTDTQLTNEVWKDVIGYEGYYMVSDIGRIKSLERRVYWTMPSGAPANRLHPERIKCQYFAGSRREYHYACFNVDGVKETRIVHRMLLEAFVGPCPTGMQACHNDGNPTNNTLTNLRWDTVSNNHADKKLHGTYLKGETAAGAKLTEQDVRDIRVRLAAGDKHIDIADDYPCTRDNISAINTGKSWRHVI